MQGYGGDVIHTCSLQEDYDVVTNDYYRAKSLFSGTKVKVFTKGEPYIMVMCVQGHYLEVR